MRVTMTVIEGPNVGQTFAFAGHDTFLVGRSKRAHFRLPANDRYFSRIHFMLEINPPQCRLMDMGSRNGIQVNGQRVQSAALKDGDQIRAGKTVLQVKVDATPEPAPESPQPPIEQTLGPPQPPARATAISIVAPAPHPLATGLGNVAPAPPPTPPSPSRLAPPPLPVRTAALPAPAVPVAPVAPAPAARSVTTAGLVACPGCSQPLPDGPGVSPWLCPACEALAADQQQPIPGFRILKQIGQGAMGVVYLAIRNVDAKAVALKTVTPAVAGSKTQVQRFLREAEILRQLTHPHIVGFRDMGESDGVLYFAMDYVHGRDASKVLKREGTFTVTRAVTFVCQMLEALAFAHARGFVHRDIKPSNLLVTEEFGKEVIKVVDFGLARVYQASQLSGLTLTGDIGGTLAFMPPEQITEYREARPAADQYAAAATLYNFLTGAHKHDLPAEFHQQILHILQEDAVPIQKRRKNLPKPLCDAIHKALAREPEDRFPDVGTFREALLPFRDK